METLEEKLRGRLTPIVNYFSLVMKLEQVELTSHEVLVKKMMKAQAKMINDVVLPEILRLLNSENTEGVSDASHKSGVLHGVGESHVSGQTDNDSLASGELPLEKITEAKEDFPYAICFECNERFETELDTQGHRCRLRKSD